MSSSYKLEVNNVSFKYKNNPIKILKNINLQVEEGEVIGIVGLSGSGKTTFMHVLNGLIPRRISGEFSGSVKIDGTDIANKDISDLAMVVGTVFQDPDTQLFFSCVEDEIAFGPENMCINPEEIKSRIINIAELLSITHLLKRNPNTLSGGEKQLVVIASILSLNVKLLILDESMSQIDTYGKSLVMNAIRALKSKGTTIIMVEHEFCNLALADRIFMITDGEMKPFEGELK